MLNQYPVNATLPSTDLKRTKDFYEEKLGLKVNHESDGEIVFDAGKGTCLYLYKRGPSKADHTVAEFKVEDVEKVVDELTAKGVKFEQYDMPGWIKTNEKGIAELGDGKGAWFKDPDGNILAVGQWTK